MMRSLFSGVSGLKNHQTRMDVIGNNISNVNTTGFKSSRVTFVDTLSQTLTGASAPKGTLGGTNPKQIGLGSNVGSIDVIFTDGSVQSTGKNTDLCLSGNGLFVVRQGNETYYTRDGAFEFDADGNYVLPGSGMYVQGWTGQDGNIDTTAATGNIVVQAGKSMAAKATQNITYNNNLNSSIPMVVAVAGGVIQSVSDSAPVSLAVGTNSYNVTDMTGDVPLDASLKWTAQPAVAGATTIDVTSGTIITAASAADPVTMTIGGNTYTVTGVSGNIDLSKKWTASAITAADTTATITDADGNSVTLTLDTTTQPTATSGGVATLTGGTTVAAKKVTLTLSAPIGAAEPGGTATISGGVTEASTTSPVTVTLSDGSTVTQTNGTYNVGDSLPVTTTATIYDSLGATHNVPIYFKRLGTYTNGTVTSTDVWLVSLNTNQWSGTSNYTHTEDDGTDVSVDMDVTQIQFTSSGRYNTATSSSGKATLTFTGGSIGTGGTVPGVPETQSVTVDFSALTQFSGNNTVVGKPDGNAAGTLKSVQIDSSGTITGVYTNGVRQAEAQVAVAQFTNASGLTKTGNSLYQESNNSGVPNIKTAMDLGVTITPSALEMSNVDVANEFSDMIITQRGFQSNSKIVTVSDEMLETVINMKR